MAGSSPTSSADPAGGGENATRDSTKRRPPTTVSASSSGPAGLEPTDVTCAPGSSHSKAKIGSLASVQQQTTSAPRTACSKSDMARALAEVLANASAWAWLRD